MDPRSLIQRAAPDSSIKPIVAVSIPKSGTHLLERLLCLHPNVYRPMIRTVHPNNVDTFGGFNTIVSKLRPHQLLLCHLPWSEHYDPTIEGTDVSFLLMIRDPRDIFFSHLDYVTSRPRHPWHNDFVRLSSDIERANLLIQGTADGRIRPFSTRIESYLPWQRRVTETIRFEQLVDSPSVAEATVASLLDALGIPNSPRIVDRIVSSMVSPLSPTFSRGKAGAWVSRDDELIEAFRQGAGTSVSALGYSW